MTGPILYLPKMLGAITALFNDGSADATQAILDWVNPLLLEGSDVYVGLGGRVFIQINGRSTAVSPQQYVYSDEDGFHVVDKGSFELNYQVSDGI